MNGIFLDLGFIKIYWYSVMILIALLIGGSLVIKEGKKWSVNEDFLINLFFYLIPLSIIGARLYFVAFNSEYYKNNVMEIFKTWEGGLAIHGAIIVGLLFLVFYTKKHKVSTFRLLDMMAVGMLIGQAIGRWGNFFNQEAYGVATSAEFLKKLFIPQFIIDGMQINGVYYHPTFLYESLWCFVGFILILLIRRYKYLKIGQLTSFYLIWYGLGRFFVEYLRTDSLMYNNLKMAQLASIAMVFIGIILYFIKNRGSRLSNLYNDEENVENVIF
ncbi:MAG: prolipoprotein diacylglyceryl transferase [Bacilli bacterium]|nr:prolipoprotein diacylglyceryl transferase [Bacilli bacterium]MDD4282369.1 prolipoprotein diacylglyceryl transferase [Bacilli bacterium]MDD4718256.1 prolipoprotein diacylglyceryl transferase [Bacilli bacterium]